MENKTTENQTEESNPKMDSLKAIGFGLLLFGIAYYFYSTMTSYEHGESVRMNVILMLAYKFLGKMVSTGLISLLGVLSVFSGIKGFLKA